MGEFDDLIGDFLIESREHLEQLERDLLSLEKNPKDRVALVCIFRSIHTLKGNCGFLGFSKLESVAHAGENLLSLIRDERLDFNEDIATALLGLTDTVRNILQSLDNHGNEGDTNPSQLVQTLKDLQKGAKTVEQLEAERAQAEADQVAKAKAPKPETSPDQGPGKDDKSPDLLTSSATDVLPSLAALEAASNKPQKADTRKDPGDKRSPKNRRKSNRYGESSEAKGLGGSKSLLGTKGPKPSSEKPAAKSDDKEPKSNRRPSTTTGLSRSLLEESGIYQAPKLDGEPVLKGSDALDSEELLPDPEDSRFDFPRDPTQADAPVKNLEDTRLGGAPDGTGSDTEPELETPSALQSDTDRYILSEEARKKLQSDTDSFTREDFKDEIQRGLRDQLSESAIIESGVLHDLPNTATTLDQSTLITSGEHNFMDLMQNLGENKARDSQQTKEVDAFQEQAGMTQTLKIPNLPEARRDTNRQVAETSIRIDTKVLDELMNLVGELVLTRNQLLQLATIAENTDILAGCQQLSSITTRLHDRVMKSRMQPIARLWSKFPRLVRNVSRLCHKSVRLEFSGEDTELDRTLIEAIKDPLTHLVRNAIDHGIEAPAERLRLGKARDGRLLISATQESDQVRIVVRDDGAGINPDKLRARLLERGLMDAQTLKTMSTGNLISSIFLPGFSTTDQVTMVSGRGVGMDVIKANIERIGGKIQVSTMPGSWTAFTLTIPLTLAIIPSLLIYSNNQRYAIPQHSVLELLRLSDERLREFEAFGDATVWHYKGEMLPILNLNEVLKSASADPAEDAGQAPKTPNIMVLKADQRKYGLIVERLGDSQEIVVKALSRMLQNIPVYSGATILDDGHVALILDVLGIARFAGIHQIKAPEVEFVGEDAESFDDLHSLLVFSLGDNWRMGIPLKSVWRLIELRRHEVQTLNKQPVLTYEEQLIPLVDLERFYDLDSDKEKSEQDEVQVLLCTHDKKNVAILIDQAVEIVEQQFQIQAHAAYKGCYASAVIDGRATDLIDVKEIIRLTHTTLLEAPGQTQLET